MYWRMDGSRYLECPSANSNGSASVRTVLLTSNSTRKSSESHTMSCIWDTGLSDDPSMLSLDLEPTLKPLLKLSMATYLPSSLHLTVNGKEDAVDTTTAHIDQVAVPCNMSRRHRSCCASPPSYSAQPCGDQAQMRGRTQRVKAWLARGGGTAVVPCSSNVRP